MLRKAEDSITAASLSQPLSIECASTIKDAADKLLALDLRAHAALQLRITRVRAHCEDVIKGTVLSKKKFYDERLRILDEVNTPGTLNAHIVEIVNECFRALGGAPRHRNVLLFDGGAKPPSEKQVIDPRSVKQIGKTESGETAEFAFEDPKVRETWEWMQIYAPTDKAMLIQADTGCGKDLLARAIHMHSARADKPFYKLNIATLSPNLIESELFGHEKGAFTSADKQKAGAFEAAGDGTLFIDELGEMPLEMQAKLLTVLEGGGFYRVGDRTKLILPKARIVAATNLNVQKAIADGKFRLDLYYRLGVRMEIPTLKERTDLDFLIGYFLSKVQPPIGIDADAAETLRRYGFPGNVRELQQIISNAAVAAAHYKTPITDAIVRRLLNRHADPLMQTEKPDAEEMERREAERIVATLNEFPHKRGFHKAAAQRLGMSRNALGNRIAKYGIYWNSQANCWSLPDGRQTA